MFSLEEIREHLQDFAEKNKLLDEQEFTDREIEVGYKDAVNSFNTFPPNHIVFSGSINNQVVCSMLMEGTLSRIYRGKAFQHLRNQLDFQDGGGAGSIDNKGPGYTQLAETLSQNFERRVREWKKFVNLNQGYGSLGSDYSSLPFA